MIVKTALMATLVFLMAVPDAEARRRGGGSKPSKSYSSTYSPKPYKTRSHRSKSSSSRSGGGSRGLPIIMLGSGGSPNFEGTTQPGDCSSLKPCRPPIASRLSAEEIAAGQTAQPPSAPCVESRSVACIKDGKRVASFD